MYAWVWCELMHRMVLDWWPLGDTQSHTLNSPSLIACLFLLLFRWRFSVHLSLPSLSLLGFVYLHFRYTNLSLYAHNLFYCMGTQVLKNSWIDYSMDFFATLPKNQQVDFSLMFCTEAVSLFLGITSILCCKLRCHSFFVYIRTEVFVSPCREGISAFCITAPFVNLVMWAQILLLGYG